jgi:phosphatidylglycerol:prolipoprotein diacylglycerol transferase
LLLFKVWHGGMSSHGGMIGMTLAIYFFARSRSLPFLAVMDDLVCTAPAGLFFGRLANYINGELWGRVTSVPWAVVFPQEAGLYPPQPGLREEALGLLQSGVLHPRHPSQLYEAFLEGLLLLAVMLWVRRTHWARSPGRLCAVFLGVYGAGRFTVEFFREPEIVHGWMTQGQLLSLFLFIPAVWLLARANRTNETTPSRKNHG